MNRSLMYFWKSCDISNLKKCRLQKSYNKNFIYVKKLQISNIFLCFPIFFVGKILKYRNTLKFSTLNTPSLKPDKIISLN